MQTQPSEMIERVARALWVQHTGRGDWWDDPSYAALTEETRNGYRGFARAAIAAMREPSQAMIEAGGKVVLHIGDHRSSADVWRAMIDEVMGA
jgi:hypothetical protein